MTLTKITQQLLREYLNYDPISGVLTWRKPSSKKTRVGDVAGSISTAGHLQVKLFYRTYQAHQLIWLYVHGHWPKALVDHIDGNKTNNALSNLREATYTQNAFNRVLRSDNLSGYKGVRAESSSWRARIWDGSRNINIGTYPTAEEAARAYDLAAIARFGEFAKTNQALGLL